jgi:hypothetical protein
MNNNKNSNIFLVSFLVIILISCNISDKKILPSENPKITNQTTNNLSGHVYLFGPGLDSTECKVSHECDCCSDDFLFLNSNDFIRISYCMADQDVQKGTYMFDKENVILKYDSIYQFTEYDSNNDTIPIDKYENLVKSKIGEVYFDTLKKFIYEGKVFYENLSEQTVGTISENDSINNYILDLKNNGFWYKIYPIKK